MPNPRFLLLLLLLLPLTGSPDEGQWLPQQFLQKNWNVLRARGLELSRDELWHPEKGGLLSAVVNLNGCSASFVSADGLLVTNHHCGFGAINRLSSVEHNRLEEGFVAAGRKEELPAAGITVFVVKRIENVTERVHRARAGAKTDLERYAITREVTRRIAMEAQAAEPHTSCRVASFLDGRSYHLYVRTRIPDVRLVYAPPRSVGEYGGEEDNWMWPRHTGDFTFFRAYVGPDGRPAPYSPRNVPYRPRHWLRVSGRGVKEGDLVLILGYPGRTERYLTSVAVEAREKELHPLRLRIFRKRIAILQAAGRDDPKKALALSADQRLAAVDDVAGELDGEGLAALLYRTTPLRNPGGRRELWNGKQGTILKSDEPLVRLARGLAADLEATRLRNRNLAGRRLVVGSAWIEAQEAFRGHDFYPDANGTLRISVATVKGYRPRDGVLHLPYTTLRGILEKETGREPFRSPEPLLRAARGREPSRFRHPELGDVPVCFLSDGDTTGGNSGSPVINGKGELVGLNFDRVFENIAGDYGWNAERSRNISVDIRYVLWNLEKVRPAPELLKELGL